MDVKLHIHSIGVLGTAKQPAAILQVENNNRYLIIELSQSELNYLIELRSNQATQAASIYEVFIAGLTKLGVEVISVHLLYWQYNKFKATLWGQYQLQPFELELRAADALALAQHAALPIFVAPHIIRDFAIEDLIANWHSVSQNYSSDSSSAPKGTQPKGYIM